MTGEHKQINKSAIRNFSIQARNILMKSAVTEAGFYGVSKDQIKNPIQKGPDFEVYETLAGTEKRIYGPDIRRRANLVAAIRQKGFDEVIEETAYTWFNRLIAIRFMEINKYLPFRTRVLSSDAGSITPDIVNRFMDLDLHMTDEEVNDVQKEKEENRFDEAFRLLFIKVCNELNDILPGLFEKTDDYMELLLRLPYTSDGVVRMLVDTIPESNFNVNEGGQVEIIGWLYQYYNTEPKAKAFAKKGKITKEEIPAVTQLFTPDWIVRYMVENSLGRLWIEHQLANGDSRSEQEIANDFGWKYYLPEAEQEPEVAAQLLQIRAERKDLTPEEILCIDPCQGSGHILVYLFDVLMQIYREEGYSERDAARSILENNIYGLDIDDRAYQLSYFAVLMKAREYDRMILKKHIEPHVYSIQESNTIDRNHLKYFGADMNEFDKNNATKQLTRLLDTFIDAKEYGSILNVDPCDWELLREFVENDRVEGQFAFDALGIEQTQKQVLRFIDIGRVVGQKYYVVITNPPYMNISGGDKRLNEYVKKNYPDSKMDLFSVFLEKCIKITNSNCFLAMITMHGWMFLSSFEKLRRKLKRATIVNMNHLGARAFDEIGGEVVQTTSFVYRNSTVTNYKSVFNRLVEPTSQKGKEHMFLLGNTKYYVNQDDFSIIPGAPIAYWISNVMLSLFEGDTVSTIGEPKSGMTTTDNDRFLRCWFEPNFEKIGFGYGDITETIDCKYKWFPFCKGGDFRRWYGNETFVVNWFNNGSEIRKAAEGASGGRLVNVDVALHECIVWTKISSSAISLRYKNSGVFFSDAAPGLFAPDNSTLLYLLGLLNTKYAQEAIKIINPTLNFVPGAIACVPVAALNQDRGDIEKLVLDCIKLSKEDWDSFETSWSFCKHPLISIYKYKHDTIDQSIVNNKKISDCFKMWVNICSDRFLRLKKNEENLNRIIIKNYGLQEEIDFVINEKDITVHKAEMQCDIRSLISYAVGCMFGRYSLDVEGLAYAGGDWKETLSAKYKTFLPDEDAIIPITDEEYFKDDIVARFVDFVRIVYGEDTLEENLKFIADALGNKGESSRAVIRNYFLNDFYKDHCITYSVTGSGKRPIYWLFDSGKQNGFKALIYIHRYTQDTVGLIRSKYLHNAQAAIQNALQNSEYIIASTTSATERARETKKRDKYVKQLNELRPYYQALTHIALQRIPMDLDDGVKKNYQLFQNVEISTEGKKKQLINLLAKI